MNSVKKISVASSKGIVDNQFKELDVMDFEINIG